jgi:hypothetical protein
MREEDGSDHSQANALLHRQLVHGRDGRQWHPMREGYLTGSHHVH